jgi:uncharacterized protein (TIGR03435 family)
VTLPPGAAPAFDVATAVQDQLGLRLESARGPVDVVLIDRLEPLIEN